MARALADASLERDARDLDGLSPLWGDAAMTLSASDWVRDEFDLASFDDQVAHRMSRRGRCELRLVDDQPDPDGLAEVAWQVATRFQRFERATNPASTTPFFEQVLESHGRLFNRRRPLVAADHDHALDTWRWLLRLEPHAGMSLQLAALFHDVERVANDVTRRQEQEAVDFAEFKRAHAQASALLAQSVLESLRTPGALIERTCALIARHEAAGVDPELDADVALLACADALSFFSLGSAGALKHFGAPFVARKVAHDLAKLDGRGHALLPRLKLARAVRAMVMTGADQHVAGGAPAPEALAPAIVEPRP